MSEHHDAHSSAHHNTPDPHAWMAEHLGGIIMPFGDRVEKLFDRFMFLMVNNFFKRVALLYVVIAGPLLLIEFLFKYVGV